MNDELKYLLRPKMENDENFVFHIGEKKKGNKLFEVL